MDINSFSQKDLILFCILKIEQKKEDCTFERLVYECFRTFPERFSFYTYKLPDSIKLDRQLRTLRKLDLATGNNTYGFKLTEKGHRLAMQMQKIVMSSVLKSSRNRLSIDFRNNKVKGGRKEQIMIKRIVSSSVYKRFEEDSDIPLTIDEIRVVFFGTLETPLRSLIDNIEYIEKIAQKSQNTNLLKFINKCRKFIESKLKKG